MTGESVFIWGVVGGIAAEAVAMRAIFQNDKRRWSLDRKRPAYWIFAAAFCLLGGGTALAHMDSGAKLTALLAFNVGATWPLILHKGAGALPPGQLKYVD
jgi:hypothetical protein